MNITDVLYCSDRKEWRKWLKKNYKTWNGVWLVYYRKESGKPRIAYNDAVEEALCFGWIDSTVKALDKDRFAQRFSPRNPKSSYSQANKERLKMLMDEGKIMKDILPSLKDITTEQFVIPKDIVEAIKSNHKAYQNFKDFSQSYIRIRIAFIDGARNRPEEFQKRLDHFIKMTEKNKQFGFGGIEKYY